MSDEAPPRTWTNTLSTGCGVLLIAGITLLLVAGFIYCAVWLLVAAGRLTGP